MANEIRKRANFLSGTIDDNPLSNSATTLNSTELAALPAVDSTEHMALVLDPTGAGNGPEIVWVTAHTGSATSATIVRGREGTSGVAHASTITWVHTATASDFTTTGTTANRPSGGGLPFRHQRYYDTTLGCEMVYDGSAWLPAAMHEDVINHQLSSAQDINSTSYVDLKAASTTMTFTKRATSTSLYVALTITGLTFNAADPGAIGFGIKVGSTDYDIGRLHIDTADANEATHTFAGHVEITGVSAGSLTIIPRAKQSTTSGGALAYIALDGSISYSVRESAIGN